MTGRAPRPAFFARRPAAPGDSARGRLAGGAAPGAAARPQPSPVRLADSHLTSPRPPAGRAG